MEKSKKKMTNILALVKMQSAKENS